MAEEFNSSLADELRSSVMRQAREIDPQLALDVAGIFDPTGIADAASTGVSLWNGQWLDAALGGVSMIPYLGDAVAKPFKIARRYGEPAVKIVDGAVSWLRSGTERMTNALRQIEPAGVQRARERAAEAVRNAQARRRANCNLAECRNIRRSRMPNKGGRWDPPNARETGNGTWHFTDANGNPQAVPYRNGYPDFSGSFKGGGRTRYLILRAMSCTIPGSFKTSAVSVSHQTLPYTIWRMAEWRMWTAPCMMLSPIRVFVPSKIPNSSEAEHGPESYQPLRL